MHHESTLEIKDIKKTYSGREILKGIDLSVSAGEFITILGASGGGKSTLLRIIAGFEDADEGSMTLGDLEFGDLPPERRPVNMVFQDYALFPHMNVEKNVGYSLKKKRLKKDAIKEKTLEILELVQMGEYAGAMPDELSGGQKQRVALARALVNEPRVLLLDEPLAALDLNLRRQMQQRLKELQKKLGITFVYITHDQEEALNLSDRIGILHNGLIEQVGTPREIYERPRTSYVANFVDGANIYKEGSKTYAIRCENVRIGDREARRAKVVSLARIGGKQRVTFVLSDGQRISADILGVSDDFTPDGDYRIGWNEKDAVEVEDNGI